MNNNEPSKAPHLMIAGVCVRLDKCGLYDYDELLREGLRLGLRIDTNPAQDDFHLLHTRIAELMQPYVDCELGAPPPVEPADISRLMAMLAVTVSDVIPLEQRKRWLARAAAS